MHHILFAPFILISGFFAFTIGALAMAFWIWMLVDCATNEPSEGNNKIIWILVILFAHFIGAALYFFIRRPERLRTS